MPFALLLAVVAFFASRPALAQAPVTLGVEAEAFQFSGDWSMQSGLPETSGSGFLFAGTSVAKLPAVTAVQLPRAGRYHLWVRAMDFPDDRPGIRRLSVSVGGTRSTEMFGDSHRPGWSWEPGGAFDLPAGPVLLGIHDLETFARVDALLLTTDAAFVPSLPLGRPGHPRVEPLALPMPPAADPFQAGPVQDTGGMPAARLENEQVRIEFVPATRDGRPTVRPRVSVRSRGVWRDAGADPAAEAYVVVRCRDAALSYPGYYPAWSGGPARAFTAEAGGAKLATGLSAGEAIWSAGEPERFLPRAATAGGNQVRLEFHPSPAGTLAATWELRPGEQAARVRLDFTPAAAGEYALGYHLCFSKPLAGVAELLLPMMWQRRRLPSRPYTLLNPFTPTPIALVQPAGPGEPLSWALVGEPAEIPFTWPDRRTPRFGLMIRSLAGDVQPAIYGPVPGTEAARAAAGKPLSFSFRVLAQPGDWYAGFRTAADQVFGLRDYRSNAGVSLTDAVLNMIDLVMDDEHGGWWERAKGPYQIETLNGATHASPLTCLELYRLTGDPAIYRRRALPAMEYVLSRNNAHFSPTPDDTGPRYPAGGMDGPSRIWGTTVMGAFRELAHRRTPAFKEWALPEEGPRLSGGYSHIEAFEEWLARHLLTGEPEALQRARELADRYLELHVVQAPAAEISPQPFFNLSFVPDWEGLLRMYEVTGEKRYLDGAVFGAKQLMTGIWTQPLIPEGTTTLHPGGEFGGDGPERLWWKGPVRYRLGFPRRPGDAPEHQVPAWVVSNVGVGFEQPITYTSGSSGGRMIFQAAFAPNFLRLAAYTGDKTFEIHARNAVVGRWANYPGYYITGFTDLPRNPRYPLDGPDVTSIYYHHILPHLSWTIDTLVAEAALRSGGKIAFPSQRQMGYAWFDSRIYGYAPGKVYGDEGAWLWLRRGLVTVSNAELNWLTAHSRTRFLTVLMNESSEAQSTDLTFSAAALHFDPAAVRQVTVTRADGTTERVPLAQGKARVSLPARGLAVVALDGVDVDVPAHRSAPPPRPGALPGTAVVRTAGGIEARAAAIQVDPGPWDAYVWCTASPNQARRVVLRYTTGGARQEVVDTEYPFEFSVPVSDPSTAFHFRLDVDGAPTPEAAIGATQ